MTEKKHIIITIKKTFSYYFNVNTSFICIRISLLKNSKNWYLCNNYLFNNQFIFCLLWYLENFLFADKINMINPKSLTTPMFGSLSLFSYEEFNQLTIENNLTRTRKLKKLFIKIGFAWMIDCLLLPLHVSVITHYIRPDDLVIATTTCHAYIFWKTSIVYKAAIIKIYQ